VKSSPDLFGSFRCSFDLDPTDQELFPPAKLTAGRCVHVSRFLLTSLLLPRVLFVEEPFPGLFEYPGLD